MKNQITISYPKSLALSLKWSVSEFSSEMKRLSVLKLYELGKISSSLGAQILGIERLDFLELLSKYNISYFSPEINLEKDLKNA